MTKSEAFDYICEIVVDGVNCWDRESEDEVRKSFAYLTGVIETLYDFLKEEK